MTYSPFKKKAAMVQKYSVGGGGGVYCHNFFLCSFIPVQQTTSGIGYQYLVPVVFFGSATHTLNVRNNCMAINVSVENEVNL